MHHPVISPSSVHLFVITNTLSNASISPFTLSLKAQNSLVPQILEDRAPATGRTSRILSLLLDFCPRRCFALVHL